MTVILGAIARCLYIIGDILLFRFVFGYEFAKPAYRKVCGLMLLLGFVGIVKIYGTIASYILLFMGFKLLFMNIQLGILAFVTSVFMVMINIIDGFVICFLCENDMLLFFSRIENGIYSVIVQLFFILIIVVILKCDKLKNKLKIEILNNTILIIGTLFISFPILLSRIWSQTNYIRLEDYKNYLFLESSMLCLFIAILTISILMIKEKQTKLKEQIELNGKCIKEQTEQYRMLSSKQEELRAFRHDVKGHLLVLQKMAKDNDIERVLQYLEANLAMQETIGYISSNNIIGDAIFNYYYDKAKKEGLKFEVLGKFADDFDIEETDLCVILTNVISNAYEAAVKCGTGSRVTVKISRFEQYTMIVVSNPVKEQPILENGIMKTTKADKENHGLGIKNTIKAVEKNNGQIIWKQECSKIFTEIIL